jgi:hypothetical protein
MPAPAAKQERFLSSFAFCSTNKLPHGIIASHLSTHFSRRRGSHHPWLQPPTSFRRLLSPRVGIQQRYGHIQIHTYMSTRTHTSTITACSIAADRHLSASTLRLYSSLYAPYICLLIYLSRTVFSFFFIQSCFFVILSPPVHFFVCPFTPSPSQYAISVCFGTSFVVYTLPSLVVTQLQVLVYYLSHRIFIAE